MREQSPPRLQQLPPQELHQISRETYQAVADLHQVNRGYGWCRLLLLFGLLSVGGYLYWQSNQLTIALTGLLLAGLSESAFLIATHEAIHGTLLALPRWEAVLSCLISWPLAWPSITYRAIHPWHHRWNNCDPRDPERIEPCTRPWLKYAVFAGGIGLICTTIHQAWLLRREDTRLKNSLAIDAAGICLVHGLILGIMITQGVLGKYLLSWLVVERIVGIVMQTRNLVEHWGLLQPRQNHLLSQLYGSRNVATFRLLNTLMGGLPYHSAHHAFPFIPFQHLPEATSRIEGLLLQHGLPQLPRSSGYISAVRQLQ